MSTGTAITGCGVHTPDAIITNQELCVAFNQYVRRENQRNADAIAAGEVTPLQESSPEFIEKASGIKQRYAMDKTGILDPDRLVPNLPDRPDDEFSYQCELAVGAAEKALAKANRHVEDIDLVIVATSNVQRLYPSIGIEVQSALGTRGYAYDMTVGCSSATLGLRSAVDAVRVGSATRALVVTPEMMTGHLNFKDRDSHFIFGDAATAMVVEPVADAHSGHAFEILSTRAHTRFSSNIRNNGGFINRCDPTHQFDADKLFYQQGRRVFKDIVPLAPKFMAEHLADHEIPPDQVSRFWLHQANINLNNLVVKRLIGRDATHEVAPLVLGEYANTASAGCVIAFGLYHEDLPRGAYGVMCSFGAGYSLGSALLKKL